METVLIGAGVVAIIAALLFMVWQVRSVAEVADLPAAPQPLIRQGVPSVDRAKVDANLRRFTRALEQNTKGKLRERELKDNLEYWRLQDKALRLRGE
jgi:hypothetical protein